MGMRNAHSSTGAKLLKYIKFRLILIENFLRGICASLVLPAH